MLSYNLLEGGGGGGGGDLLTKKHATRYFYMKNVHYSALPKPPGKQPGGPVRQPYAIVNFIPLVRDYESGL